MIPVLIMGTSIGLSVIQIAKHLIASRRPKLSRRINAFLPGLRVSRNSVDVEIKRFLLSAVSYFKMKFSEGAIAKSRKTHVLFELPDFIDMLAVAISGGEGLYSSLKLVSQRASGVLANEFRSAVSSVEMGADLEAELQQLAKRLGTRQVEEFVNKVNLAKRRGVPLSGMLRGQAESIRAEVKNELLIAAGRNETRMLIPLVFLILPVTVLFAVYPSLQLLQASYL
jgi:Flp pilus assembly protein TadB